MQIMFDKYIDNPAGKGAVVTNRSMYKTMYTDKFNKVLLRENGKIEYTLYKSNDKYDSHYVYLKIPSEVISNFYYDVVIQFYTTSNAHKNEANLRRYFVKFYSNDPAFVYTFAHAFVKNKLFIEDLAPKMSKEALKNVAKVKNPKDNVWYVKSLYFAYLAIEKYHLFNKSYYTGLNVKKYNKKELLSRITQADIKIKDRQNAAENERKNKENSEEAIKKYNQDKNTGVGSKTSNASKNVKKVKSTGLTKKTKNIKTSKTISAKKK